MNEVVKRTLSGIIYIALLIGAILFSNNTFLILFGFFLLVAVYEFCKLYKINFASGFALSAVFCFSFFFLNNRPLNILYLVVLPFSVYLTAALFKNTPYCNRNQFQKLLHLAGYVVLPFLIISQLPFGNQIYSPWLLLSIFIMMWCNDTFAYICGRLFGKHKLYEKISPKKTIEGFVGGLLFTQIAALVLFKTTNMPFSLFFWLTIALTASTIGTIGDLVESKYKRQAEVKDSGAIMPGHGGILDRLDSILFAAPFLFLIYKLFM